MRANFRTFMIAPALLLAVACGKTDYTPGEAPHASRSITDKDTQKKVIEMAGKLPDLAIYNSTMDKVIIIEMNQEKMGFNFADPNDGWSFASSDNIQFTQYGDGTNVVFIGSPTSGGGGATGGTVVAGNTALDIAYSFCFSVNEEALGLDLFSVDADFDGISGVIGIAGDFEALANGEIDEDADITDFFQGYAMYFVYDDEANGTYDILNWLEDVGSDGLDGDGFSFVFDFQNFDIYFSNDGTLDVSASSMMFDGTYLGFINFFESFFDEDGDLEDADIQEVSGYGEMGC